MAEGSMSSARFPALTSRRRDLLIALTALIACAWYLVSSWNGAGALGFPLDDGWIYQTYARNLARTGQWAFVPGLPSTGSTSIWWTLLLAPGFRLPVSTLGWTYGVGWLSLAAAGWAADRLVEDRSPLTALAAGLAVVLSWQLVWAAVSGMETALFAAGLLWFFVWLKSHDPAEHDYRWQNGLLIGLWGGGLMLARPEGVLAPALAGGLAFLAGGRNGFGRRLVWALAGLLGFGLVLGPFFAFNARVSGSLWPNTFYAKQTEYAVLWLQPYVLRLWQQARSAFVGGQALLLPGLGWWIWRQVRERRWLALVPLLWVVVHWGLYAARLPVVYQHGRYALPTAPILTVCGLEGLAGLVRPRSRRPLIRLFSRAWPLTVAALYVVVLAVLGGPAYGRDVAFIEEEMVTVARWLEANTPPDAVIAAHDIGALGYFAPRPLIDLAGLVSPQVVPYMHDPARLSEAIVSGDAAYLVVFPGWNDVYAALIEMPSFQPVWSAAEQPGYKELSPIGPLTVYAVSP